MSNPSTTNSAATIADSILKNAETGIVALVEAQIIAAAPWLALPIINPLFNAAFKYVADKFTVAAQTGATFEIIDVQVNAESSALNSALAQVVAAEKSKDPTQIKEAILAFSKAQSALANYNGSATPQ